VRTKAKRDKSESLIIEGLRQAGYSVYPLSQAGLPDLLVGRHGKTYLIECKSRYGKLTAAQINFYDEWDGTPLIIAYSLEDALKGLAALESG
jgi:Holliday junction resolvase